MKIQKPLSTESTFSTNSQVKEYSGYSNVNRSDVKDISITFYDVDFAIKWHIENVIQPTITEDDKVLKVPIMFSTGEKWATVQKYGFLRDNQGKLLTPLIMIKRNAVSKREDIQDIKVLETPDARITFEKKYSSRNRYDRFNLINNQIPRELYSIDVPKFVQVEYDLMIWTNEVSQLNDVIQQLLWFDGKAFGDTFKFNTMVDTPSFESVNATGEDRLQRATMPLRTKARILAGGPNAPVLYKLNPVNKVVIGIETELNGSSDITKSRSTSMPVVVNETTNNPMYKNAMIYINTNIQKTGNVIDDSTVTFNSGWLTAPIPLPATSINNFVFFINGQFVEKDSIISFTQNNGVSTLIVNTTLLGYTLSNTDLIIAIGKFIN